jgi:hypothetical protein
VKGRGELPPLNPSGTFYQKHFLSGLPDDIFAAFLTELLSLPWPSSQGAIKLTQKSRFLHDSCMYFAIRARTREVSHGRTDTHLALSSQRPNYEKGIFLKNILYLEFKARAGFAEKEIPMRKRPRVE